MEKRKFNVDIHLKVETDDLTCCASLVNKFKEIVEAVNEVKSKVLVKNISVEAREKDLE